MSASTVSSSAEVRQSTKLVCDDPEDPYIVALNLMTAKKFGASHGKTTVNEASL
jgi:hypothetical protein